MYFFVFGLGTLLFYNLPILGGLINWLPKSILFMLPIGLAWLLADVGTEGRSPIYYFRSFIGFQYRKYFKKQTLFREQYLPKPSVHQFKMYMTYRVLEEELLPMPIVEKSLTVQEDVKSFTEQAKNKELITEPALNSKKVDTETVITKAELEAKEVESGSSVETPIEIEVSDLKAKSTKAKKEKKVKEKKPKTPKVKKEKKVKLPNKGKIIFPLFIKKEKKEVVSPISKLDALAVKKVEKTEEQPVSVIQTELPMLEKENEITPSSKVDTVPLFSQKDILVDSNETKTLDEVSTDLPESSKEKISDDFTFKRIERNPVIPSAIKREELNISTVSTSSKVEEQKIEKKLSNVLSFKPYLQKEKDGSRNEEVTAKNLKDVKIISSKNPPLEKTPQDREKVKEEVFQLLNIDPDSTGKATKEKKKKWAAFK